MDFSFLTSLVDAGKLGGYVRAFVGAVLVWAIARFPGLKDVLDPQTQTEIAVAVSAIVVGIWSHYAKAVSAGVSKPVVRDVQLTGRVVSWLPLFGAGLLFSLLLAHAAFAADVGAPVKAPSAPAFFQPYAGSGWYVGLEAGGGAGSAGVSGIQGVNSASLVETQGLIGGIVGYSSDMANGNRYWFAEGDIGWNNFNGNTAGFSLTGPVTIQLLAGAGAPASQILSMLPTFNITPPTLPTLPAGTTTSNPHIYIAAGVDISDVSANYGLANNDVWQFSPLVAIGMDAQLSTGGVVGGRIEDVIQTDSACVGAVCAHGANLVRAKVLYKF